MKNNNTPSYGRPLFYCNNCGENFAKYEVRNLSVMPWRKFYWCEECSKRIEKDIEKMDRDGVPHANFEYEELKDSFFQPQEKEIKSWYSKIKE